MFTLYHNSFCSKSNCALEFLETENIPYQLVDILNNPLSKEDLEKLVQKLNVPVLDIVRTNEKLFQEEFSDKNLSNEELFLVLEANPELLQRPILEFNEEAIVGRPFEVFKTFVEVHQ